MCIWKKREWLRKESKAPLLECLPIFKTKTCFSKLLLRYFGPLPVKHMLEIIDTLEFFNIILEYFEHNNPTNWHRWWPSLWMSFECRYSDLVHKLLNSEWLQFYFRLCYCQLNVFNLNVSRFNLNSVHFSVCVTFVVYFVLYWDIIFVWIASSISEPLWGVFIYILYEQCCLDYNNKQ